MVRSHYSVLLNVPNLICYLRIALLLCAELILYAMPEPDKRHGSSGPYQQKESGADSGFLQTALSLYVLSMILDWADGASARTFNQVTLVSG